MKRLKKVMLAMLILVAFMLSACATTTEKQPQVETMENHAALAQLVDRYEAGEGSFTLTQDTCLVALDGVDRQTAEFIQMQFAAAGYPAMPLLEGAEENALVLCMDATVPSEGYELTVSSEQICLKASDTRGLVYGAFMLIKTLRANAGNCVGSCVIADAPDAAERVVMIDCGRKYYSVEWMCNFIRQSAFMGYNAIELRFSDDQGTRFDIWDPEYFTDNVNGNDFSI